MPGQTICVNAKGNINKQGLVVIYELFKYTPNATLFSLVKRYVQNRYPKYAHSEAYEV